ncbi:hypothetical protein CVT26_015378 [Gymnopilus dilepis]|uniref:GSKIP domain-containing protein n=1 Tax=Gymnopilus dilepis TaxID=231916 RepID=A0A409WD18_9AGAR|nr:hypothetical protein CVT26_015378 [Gymnopilus dilepis]
MTLADLYNLCCAPFHAPKKLGSLFDWKGERTMTVSSSPSTSFCHTELYRALKEQAFGIKSFSMLSSSLEQATASVVLLEGSKIVVELTTGGYSIQNAGGRYETLDDLLQTCSPLYAKKRQEALIAKLSRLS